MANKLNKGKNGGFMTLDLETMDRHACRVREIAKLYAEAFGQDAMHGWLKRLRLSLSHTDAVNAAPPQVQREEFSGPALARPLQAEPLPSLAPKFPIAAQYFGSVANQQFFPN